MDRPLFSDMLSERRRELGYSIRQTSRVLRLKEEVLIAFEEGDFEQMPKSGYAQGMLSSYARYLGLDARDVVSAYTQDLEDYQHNVRRNGRNGSGRNGGSNRVGQPYVGQRGLLPTSGGLAGDMGSFATTRVHTRGGDQSRAEETRDQGSYSPSRPYTGRTPSRQNRSRRTSARSDIRTMELGDYDDDLRLGRDAQPYESATTSRGRRSSRNLGNTQRPRVNRRSRDDYGRGSRDRSDRRGRGGRGGSSSSLSITPTFALIALVVVVIITVILVVSVSSCVRQNSDLSHSVPISSRTSETSESGSNGATLSNTTTTSATSGATSTAARQNTSNAATGANGRQGTSNAGSLQETSVSVSVADGAVTWLEVTVDNKSDVAQTVNGPWQRTYTVEKSLSVQAGDTTAVTVVQNGQQMQFESMASGIGTLVIEGSGKSSSKSGSSASKTSTGTSTTSSKTNNSSSNTDSAKTGNNSMVSQGDESSDSKTGSNESYSEYEDESSSDEYDSEYGY